MMHTPHCLLERFRQGVPAKVTQLTTASGLAAEILSAQGWDAVCFDMQHAHIGLSDLVPLGQAISASKASSIVRVPWNDPVYIMGALDAGAHAVICPMISTAAETADFVSAARYPPMGMRSFGPIRAGIHVGNAEYARRANEEVVTLAMIETEQAMVELDAIMATPGLDGVYVGPSDLGRALGLEYGNDWSEGPVRAAIDAVLASAARFGKVAGIYCDSPTYAREMMSLGFDFVIVSSELNFVKSGAAAALATLS